MKKLAQLVVAVSLVALGWFIRGRAADTLCLHAQALVAEPLRPDGALR